MLYLLEQAVLYILLKCKQAETVIHNTEHSQQFEDPIELQG